MDIKSFFKENKKKREHEFFPVSDEFKDETGKAIKWELRYIPTAEYEKIVDEADGNIREVSKRAVIASVVNPNLNSADLQDSYGVKTAEELIYKMLDSPAVYARLLTKVSEMSMKDSFEDKIKTAKN